MSPDDEPLQHTKRGNMPKTELQYGYAWEDPPDFTLFKEWYTCKADGEVVQESAHVYSKKGIFAQGFTAT